jgi:hypothetical protein
MPVGVTDPDPPRAHPRDLGWAPVADFDYACDLFDHRHYWEAHEVWEAEWRTLPRGSPEAGRLQGLICAAAFVIKRHQGLRDAATRLRARSTELLRGATAWRGIDVAALLAALQRFDEGGPWPRLRA